MEIRYLPVTCLYYSRTKGNILPLICISGKWLENAGFIVGDEVSVEVKRYGELVIRLLSDRNK